jgi:signal transduction histidine kinase/CheY-like chemotaxis protein
MRRHRTQSLRRRLTAMSVLLTVLALGVAGLDSYWRQVDSLETATQQNLRALCRMVAVNVKSGLDFEDRDAVANALRSTVATVGLQSALVQGDDDQPFASAGPAEFVPRPPLVSGRIGGDWLQCDTVDYTNRAGESCTGTVAVRISGAPMRTHLAEYLRGLCVTMALALLGLGAAAHWLLGALLRPIHALVRTSERVRRTEDYSLRAEAVADDEVGALVQSFNAMLDVIQERDAGLARSAERLEQQVRDRTAELCSALAAAEAATRAKSTFLANMSHEIRTPLNAVIGMAELALETEDQSEQREYLGVIRSAGANLLGILCDILDLSKVESGKLELSLVTFDLESLLADTLRPLTSRIQSKELDLVLHIDPELSRGYVGDDVRLKQVLTNLVGNAIKFSERGVIVVQVRRLPTAGERDQVEIMVEDPGVGIPSDRLEAIFQPFTQADGTITRRFAGTGLGLSITARLVQLMGGAVRVESTLGRGSRFFVTVPMAPANSPDPELPTTPGKQPPVFVSPEPRSRAAFAAAAARLGLDATTHASLQEVTAEELTTDRVFVVDERDPDHDGLVLEVLRATTTKTHPVLLATSFRDLAMTGERVRRHGFAGHLTKPITSRELAHRLHSLVAATAPLASTPKRPVDRTLRVLVAEDNPVNQRLIERVLQKDGHAVVIAGDGRACVEAYGREPFDVVLMDVQMPEMSGLEACQAIRQLEVASGARVPIVALTANTSPEDREACLLAGMDSVLPKPVSLQRLRATLAELGATTDPSPAKAHEGPAS